MQYIVIYIFLRFPIEEAQFRPNVHSLGILELQGIIRGIDKAFLFITGVGGERQKGATN